MPCKNDRLSVLGCGRVRKKTEPSIGAWKQWETFCARYGVDAAEALDLVEQNRAHETGILGLVERWKWSQSGDFLNVSMPIGDPGAAAAA